MTVGEKENGAYEEGRAECKEIQCTKHWGGGDTGPWSLLVTESSQREDFLRAMIDSAGQDSCRQL